MQVIDASGKPMAAGSVVFCPVNSDCLEFPIAAEGMIPLDFNRLQPGTAYTIIVYSPDRAVLYATFDWVYDPAAFAPAPDGRRAVPRLLGNLDQEIAFDFTPASGQAPAAAAAPAAAPKPAAPQPLGMPRFVAGAYVPFMFGEHFGADPDALGGVTDVAPGFGGFVAYRFGYPQSAAPGRTAVGFREFCLSYAVNRYTVTEIGDPAATSDLSFHRVSLAYGMGRLTARTLLSGAVAVGYGGVYDGSELLEVQDRTYGMVGVGFQGRCGYRLLGGPNHGLGLLGQVDLMYYPADNGDNDHWFGLAPSLAAGIVVH